MQKLELKKLFIIKSIIKEPGIIFRCEAKIEQFFRNLLLFFLKELENSIA